MRHATRRSRPRRGRSTVVRTPQFRTLPTGLSDEPPPEDDTSGDKRLALIGAADGGTLQRLTEAVREEINSNNGNGACPRLSAGDVACTCDYCELFWSRLTEQLRGHMDES